ncbi:beta-N-acetylhexosaminidase [Caulobacter sp. 17J80-11]|uniref:beta-N-acetylhexosaminidase n=1 Tax=Caulobacter sp. 17J80-11 TaxID=2763502 RepID=UPI001653D244|nr:beta-N-acetylhexosaminidase [Caulobacter sp. 17J80-11]
MTLACILGCSGPTLTPDERDFFRDVRPWGFILFRRNVETPEQVRALVDALVETTGRTDVPVLIDQEGGRVQRLRPPHWPKYPPGRAYGQVSANDPLVQRELTRLGARLIAHDLRQLGINVDCLPVLDVPVPGAHDIIGDRAYAEDPYTVSVLGRAAAEGLMAGGVLPVVKHIPGHGRAFADSHEALPTVDTALEELDAWDFQPFKALSDMPAAMTAHVVYTAIDKKKPATTSKKAVRLIREELGFGGLLMSDDLSMNALSGGLGERARDALKAGCDVVLHCNGVMAEMQQVVSHTGKLKGDAKRRAEAAMARIVRAPEPFDPAEARARFDEAFAGIDAAAGPKVGEA